ncbi:clasp N-terminal domain-containing protein [Abortiporus biennis]|nr:clasp N-terminal domain-containing protein [Abortiporus biennis]
MPPVKKVKLAHALRSLSRPLSSAILSERSRLSGVAIDLVNQSAELLGKSFDILIPIFLPTLLTVCARPNKVFISRGKTCIINIVQATQSPSILSYLVESAKDKNVTLRLSAAEAALACLNSFNPPDLEKEARGKEVESIIKSTATDASADVRKIGRQLFEAYKILLPQRVEK